MADHPRDEARRALEEHERATETLHRKLAALPHADAERLKKAIEHHKKSNASFSNDALECWKT